jgi:predicted Zn-dependent peptidase
VDWPARLQERLSALTPQQVQAVAKKYLANPLVVTVITPQPDAFPDATHLETLQELK